MRGVEFPRAWLETRCGRAIHERNVVLEEERVMTVRQSRIKRMDIDGAGRVPDHTATIAAAGDCAIDVQRRTVEPEAVAIEGEIGHRLRPREIRKVDPRLVVAGVRIAFPANGDVVHEIADLIPILGNKPGT